MLAIAHRSGNTVTGLREALDAGVDLVEADLHAYRGRLEVRHHKALGPAHLWDRWEIVARTDLVRVGLVDLLEELGADPRLMLDLKGMSPGLPRNVSKVLGTRAPDVPITICSKHWWMLDTFGPGVLPVLSASNRISLARLRRRLAAAPTYGVSVALDLVTPELVAQLKTRSDVVMTWPVDTPKALGRAQRAGVDGVISKNLDLLVQIASGP
jgi:glycerophosphoryl diester phosphodiesterase